MIFEHESGIQVDIRLIKDVKRFESSLGTDEVLVGQRLETECGQDAFPWDTDDHHDLQQVGVFTRHGQVKLRRVW